MKNQYNFKPTKIFLEIKNITANNIEQTYISLKSVIPKETFERNDVIQLELLEEFFSKMEKIRKIKTLEDSDLESTLSEFNKNNKVLKLPILIWFNFADQIIVDIIWKDADYLVNKAKLILNPEWRKKIRKEITEPDTMMGIINSSINKIANQLKLQPIQFIGNVKSTAIVESNCDELKEQINKELKPKIIQVEDLVQIMEENYETLSGSSKNEIITQYGQAIDFIKDVLLALKNIKI